MRASGGFHCVEDAEDVGTKAAAAVGAGCEQPPCPTVAEAGAEPRHKAPRCFSSCQVTHLPRSICRAHLRFVLCPLLERAAKHIHYMYFLISHAMPGPGSSAGWRILNSCTKSGLFVLRCL